MLIISGNIVNIFDETISYGIVTIQNKRIRDVQYIGVEKSDMPYIMPGFIDAHVHIESSMLMPSQFARMAVVHGTVGTVSDPHEIANVLGIEGIELMIDNARETPFKICFGAPSCVPATTFETAGASISPSDVRKLFSYKEVGYLAEVMNYPGVLNQEEDLMAKIRIAQAFGKPVDGHAPGLRGQLAKQYIEAGIQTDHECVSAEEALDKLRYGMKILIREGSAAKNFEALSGLIRDYSDKMMFCSDDKHPDELVLGHINQLVKRAIAKGIDVFKVLRVACLNPVEHYNLPVGLLREGDWADFIVVDNLHDLTIKQTYLNGILVAEEGKTLMSSMLSGVKNQFLCERKTIEDFRIKAQEGKLCRVIQVKNGQLITGQSLHELPIEEGYMQADRSQDVLKIAVINRYADEPPALGFIKNFGLKEGAIASSVAHDSHNIIAVGIDDASLCEAVNLVIEAKGGISAVSEYQKGILPLPIAGIMSNKEGYEVAKMYSMIDKFAKEVLGSTLSSPFMSLSFMGLLVIPSLKMSDKGLFDGEKFEFTSVFVDKTLPEP